MTGKKAVPRKVVRIEAHKRKQAGRGRLGAAEEDRGGGRMVHVFSVHPFKGDVVVLVGERRELCSVDEVDKVET